MKADFILIDINEYDDPAVCGTLLETLDRDRIKKTLSYKYADDRKRSLISGLLIKYFLEINGKGPGNLKYNENGKPYFDGAYFNVSHSGDYVAAVYSTEGNAACDIEQVRECRENIVSRYFSDREKAYLEPENKAEDACGGDTRGRTGDTSGYSPGHERDIRFTEIWTKKESYAKLKGERIAAVIRDEDTYELDCCFETWLHNGHVMTVCAGESISLTRRDISFQ